MIAWGTTDSGRSRRLLQALPRGRRSGYSRGMADDVGLIGLGMLGELFVTFPQIRERLDQHWARLLFPPAAFDPEQTGEQRNVGRPAGG